MFAAGAVTTLTSHVREGRRFLATDEPFGTFQTDHVATHTLRIASAAIFLQGLKGVGVSGGFPLGERFGVAATALLVSSERFGGDAGKVVNEVLVGDATLVAPEDRGAYRIIGHFGA